MTVDQLREFIEANNDEYIKFENVPPERRLSNCPDLNLFMMLDRLVPGTSDIVCDSGHDEIYLRPDVEAVAEVVSEVELLDMIRCGLRYDEDYDSFCMFV